MTWCGNILRKVEIPLSFKSSSPPSWVLSVPPQKPKPASKREVYPQQCYSHSEGSENKSAHRASTGHFIYHKGELLRGVMQQPQFLLHCAFCTRSSKKYACFTTFHSENKPLPSFSVCDARRPKRNRCLVFSLRQPSPISIWSHKCCLCKYFSSCIIFSLLL